MPWTPPKTWLTNEVLTSADVNVYLRDNLEFLGAPPACSVFNSGPQSLSNGVFVAMTANSERWDTDGMHSLVSQTSRITINTAGFYLFNATLTFVANAVGARAIGYAVNGGSTKQVQAQDNAGGSVNSVLTASFPELLTPGDFVEIQGWQATGGSLNATLDDFTAVLVGV